MLLPPLVWIPVMYRILPTAKTSYMENPDIMQKFTDALQKGMDYVQSHTPEEIAEVIEPQFPETDLDTITAIVKRLLRSGTPGKKIWCSGRMVLNCCRISWKMQVN